MLSISTTGRGQRLALLLALVLALTLALPARSAPPDHPGARPSLEGLWQGPLQLPGGRLEVIFRLVRLSSGDYFATLDVPLQKATHLAVTVRARADSVRLTSPQANSQYNARLSPEGNQLRGTWQQPGFQVPLTLTLRAPQAAPAPAAARLSKPYREEDLLFVGQAEAGGLPLGGTLTVPAGPGVFPAVVLLSDVGAQDRNGLVSGFAPLGMLADYLTRRGIAVLRFDDRGVGKSGGHPQPTLAEQVADAQAALNFLRTRPEIDLARLGLLGHGQGGNVALLAATLPLPPAFVVGLAPYGLTGAATALQQQETTLRALGVAPDQVLAGMKRQRALFEIISQTPDNAQAQAIVANMLRQNNAGLAEAQAQVDAADMVSAHFRDFLRFDPTASLPRVACPVLLLAGTADQALPPDAHLPALARGLRANKTVAVRKLPGVNHLFQPDPAQWPLVAGQPRPVFSPLAAEAIRGWIAAGCR